MQRGIETVEGAAKFLGISPDVLRHGTREQLHDLVNDYITEHAFTSCGSCKGKGFSGVIFNIYCPKGTKMIYAEPFSHYGNGGGRKWDGKKPQTSFGYEDETIIQRGTTFRITKVEKSGSGLYVDMEVIEQIGG
mgnify:CR=1 FL=1